MAAARAAIADIVIPTIGRASLSTLLHSLQAETANIGHIYLVDDRQDRRRPLPIGPGEGEVTVLSGPGRGPAAARNVGWQTSQSGWIAFLDDDVVVSENWAADLAADLCGLPATVAGSQGVLEVPLPRHRRPTDWERNVAGLEGAAWITANMALRREALEAAGGFDERFASAYREDTDLAMRLLRGGWQIARGRRSVSHPVPRAGFWTSVRLQRGNADDVLMRALHGPHWRAWGRAPQGRIRRHILYTGLLATAIAALPLRRTALAKAGGLGALILWAELAATRIAPGPRDPAEVLKMLATSSLLPVAATAARVRGLLELPRKLTVADRSFRANPPPVHQPSAVLFDRDGTLVVDVPYNGDPDRVKPLHGARAGLRRLRQIGIPAAVVSNQSGIGRGLIRSHQVGAVNQRIDEMIGPFGTWLYCPHSPEAGCACRKPAPGLIDMAAEKLGVPPERCLMVGDIAADIQAAQAAGAAAVLIPTEATEAEDITQAPWVAKSIDSVIERVFAKGAG